ncbi:MAG: hypothetical protein MJ016_03275 [Victivallaceae bacterium]|nr:hypothetical protein [Victivallaceae bacterium]
MTPNKPIRSILIVFIILTILVLMIAAFRVIGEKCGRLAGRFFRPYLALENITGQKIAEPSLLLLSRSELAEKLSALQQENRHLALRAVAADRLREENQQLRRIGRLKSAPEWIGIPAEIVLRDPLFWKNRMVANQGARAGVRRGDAVVDVRENGQILLVGVVHSVDEESAEIYTVFHPLFRFSFRLKQSGGTGFVNVGDRQTGAGTVPVEYLTTLPVSGDDEMYTTGFERQIPSGVKIGKLLSVNTSDPLYFAEKRHNGSALPAFDANTLQFVLILSRRERIFCPGCQSVQPQGSAFCPQCGAALSSPGSDAQ